jgi:hypothetical protein
LIFGQIIEYKAYKNIMTLPELFFLALGSMGFGYGLMILWRGRVRLYDKGVIRSYEGHAARYVAGGIMIASLGGLAIGILGFGYVWLAILSLIGYFVGRAMANEEANKK